MLQPELEHKEAIPFSEKGKGSRWEGFVRVVLRKEDKESCFGKVM